MRRGLIVRSKTELPDAALEARIVRVRAAMALERLDALIVYTNNTQTAGVSWLTGFVPYWSEALLVVPQEGAVRLVAALSYRVKSWIEGTSRIDEVLHAPRIGMEAGRLISALKADAAVGIVDFDHVMAGLADDLREGGPKLKLSDATALFARLRGVADHAEVALAVKAAEIARRALRSAPENEENLGVIIAAVEKAARCAGAEEIYIATAPDLARDQHLVRSEGETKVGENFALRATVSYMGTWIRLGRTFTRNAGAASHLVRAAERFSDAAAQLPNPRAFATFPHWLLESCLTTQPLAPIMGSNVAAGSTLPSGALVSLQARVSIDGRPIYLGAPALMSASGAGAKFLIDL